MEVTGPCTTCKTCHWLPRCGWHDVAHPSCSPDRAVGDSSHGKRFGADITMKQAVTWLQTLDTGVLSSGLQGLVPRWNKCLNVCDDPRSVVCTICYQCSIYTSVSTSISQHQSVCLTFWNCFMFTVLDWFTRPDDMMTVGSLQLPTFNYDGSWYVKSQSKISSVISLQHANEAGIYGTRVPRMELNTTHLIPWNSSLNIL